MLHGVTYSRLLMTAFGAAPANCSGPGLLAAAGCSGACYFPSSPACAALFPWCAFGVVWEVTGTLLVPARKEVWMTPAAGWLTAAIQAPLTCV